MTSRAAQLVTAVFAVLALSACSAAAGANEASTDTGGAIELAISETCTDGADAECVSVNGESVVLPPSFERAGVEESSIAEDGQNAVGVTFNEEGAEILRTLTEKAAGAGDSARLVMRIGGELQTAVVVMEALTGDEIQIALAPGDSAQDLVDRIREG